LFFDSFLVLDLVLREFKKKQFGMISSKGNQGQFRGKGERKGKPLHSPKSQKQIKIKIMNKNKK